MESFVLAKLCKHSTSVKELMATQGNSMAVEAGFSQEEWEVTKTFKGKATTTTTKSQLQ